jgi:hypothetical protein
MKDAAVVLDYQITHKDPKNPYGEVTDGWILIRGPMIPLIFQDHHDPEYERDDRFVGVITPWGGSSDIRIDQVRGSVDELIVLLNTKKVFALMLRQPDENCIDLTDPRPIYTALVVTPVDDSKLRMRRVGLIYFVDADLKIKEVVDDSGGYTTVRLV